MTAEYARSPASWFSARRRFFCLLATANVTGRHTLHIIAGHEGILSGVFVLHEAAAVMINEKCARNG